MRIFTIVFTIILLSFLSIHNLYAQDMKQRKIFDKGTIICSQTGRLADERHRESNIKYDSYIIGVATGEDSKLHIYDIIQTDGIALVKFSAKYGEVKKGDYLTSSDIPGTAMKATLSGKTIGVALEDSNEDSKFIKILVQPLWVKF